MQFGWISLFGLIIIIAIMIPNIIYAMRAHNQQTGDTGAIAPIIEQIGRYSCMILIIVPLGIGTFGYPSVLAMLVYLIGNVGLLIAYFVVWCFYAKQKTLSKAIALAAIPTCIFFISGVTLQHWLLVVAALLFGCGHLYITYQTHKPRV